MSEYAKGLKLDQSDRKFFDDVQSEIQEMVEKAYDRFEQHAIGVGEMGVELIVKMERCVHCDRPHLTFRSASYDSARGCLADTVQHHLDVLADMAATRLEKSLGAVPAGVP